MDVLVDVLLGIEGPLYSPSRARVLCPVAMAMYLSCTGRVDGVGDMEVFKDAPYPTIRVQETFARHRTIYLNQSTSDF